MDERDFDFSIESRKKSRTHIWVVYQYYFRIGDDYINVSLFGRQEDSPLSTTFFYFSKKEFEERVLSQLARFLIPLADKKGTARLRISLNESIEDLALSPEVIEEIPYEGVIRRRKNSDDWSAKESYIRVTLKKQTDIFEGIPALETLVKKLVTEVSTVVKFDVNNVFPKLTL